MSGRGHNKLPTTERIVKEAILRRSTSTNHACEVRRPLGSNGSG